jgi:carboxypeptidase C (cathepsin A)
MTQSSRDAAAPPPAAPVARSGSGYEPPKGVEVRGQIAVAGRVVPYQAQAGWLVLRKREKPVAEIFHVAYSRVELPSDTRPITFVFNGGPGAASAYLHVGALGPRRAYFEEHGGLPKPPARLVDNRESWLEFTDLVFVDPVGTGFSRAIAGEPAASAANGAAAGGGERRDEAAPAKADEATPENEREFYKLERDLESLCEFIQSYLSRHKRWNSPVFVAGESYGGFRAGKLARKLQEGSGVGLNGVILISPALEWVLLDPSDYDVLSWVDLFPSLAATAWRHGRSRAAPAGADFEKVVAEAEAFASDELVPFLARGDAQPEERRRRVLGKTADYLGLPPEVVTRSGGRIRANFFCRELLRDARQVCGMYDAMITALDPFPDRDEHEGPDPTLFAIERVFTGAINTHLRSGLGLETERDYRLLSMDVNQAWKVDGKAHAFQLQVGATDDLRYALSLNPHMKLFVTHGYYDLVTPYFSSKRLIENMKLAESQRRNVTLRCFEGGHMFYTRDASREAFTAAIREFFQAAL